MKTAYLSLGSNLGDRERHLLRALEKLAAAGIHVARQSSIFETEPQELKEQPQFLNMAIEIETRLFPRQLLACIQKVERELGRQRVVPKGPRTIDLDILFYGGAVIDTPGLIIPHPSLQQRRFVLEPLTELVPDFRHPVLGRTVREMLKAVSGQKLSKWPQPPDPQKKPGAGQAPG